MNSNNVLIVILSILIIALAGFYFLFGIGHTVSVALSPLSTQIGEMKTIQRDIQRKLGATKGDSDLIAQLKAINQRLTVIEGKLNNIKSAAAQKPAGGGGCGAPPSPAGGGCGGVQAPQDANKVYDIPIGDSPVLGNKKASITIVMFSDFQCPFCNRFYPVVRDVVQAYPDKVNLVIKNYPLSFHAKATPAAKLALAAHSQGKYFEMMEILQQNGAEVTDEKNKEYAEKTKVNLKKLMNDYKNKDAQWQKMIDDDMALAKKVAINGTPTFYINGKKTSARDVAAYKVEIDKILSQKK